MLYCATSGDTPRRAAKVAAVVGSVLVTINQWDAIFGQASCDWVKVGLNYLVPYLVSTYTSVTKDLDSRPHNNAGGYLNSTGSSKNTSPRVP